MTLVFVHPCLQKNLGTITFMKLSIDLLATSLACAIFCMTQTGLQTSKRLGKLLTLREKKTLAGY